MAPRKRRNRTPVSAIPTPESISNSVAASSPSPNHNSRSEDNESEKIRPKHLSADTVMSPDIDPNFAPHFPQLPPPPPPPPPQRLSRPIATNTSSLSDARSVMSSAGTAIDAVSGNDPTCFTVASVALRLYEQFIDWAVLHFAIQYKHHDYQTVEDRRRAGAFPSTGQRYRISIVPESYGSRLHFSEKNVTVKCSNCSANMFAARYAQHMEKCLGRGGRMSSRAASARLRASAEKAERDIDNDDGPPRRRRHPSTNSAADYDTHSSAPSSNSHKRRKASPAHGGNSGLVSHSGLGPRSLPPSGRTKASPK